MTLISGLSIALMTPKIAATPSSVPVFDQSLPASNWMPGTTQVATARAAAETTTRRMNLMTSDITRMSRSVRKGLLGWVARNFGSVRKRVWAWCARAFGLGGVVGGRIAAEEAAVGVGGSGAPEAEVVAQGGGVAEAGVVGDGVDGLVGLLQELLGQQDALPDEPALRGGSGVLDEAAGEGPLGHVGAQGELADGERLVEVGAQPFQEVPERPVARGRDGLLDVLGLAAVAVRRDDHAPGDAVGDPRALLLPDQVQAGVDAGGGARAADHRVVVHVQDVRVDLGLGVAAGQFVRVPPVRGAAPAVEQAGLPQDEGSAADAQHPRAAGDRATERVEQVRRELLRHAGGPAGGVPQALIGDGGQGDQVCLLEPLEAVRR